MVVTQKIVGKLTLVERVNEQQTAFARELNDIHIFLQTVIPLLKKQSINLGIILSCKTFVVPSSKAQTKAQRSPFELTQLLTRYSETGLYENFLVVVVSKYESFIVKVLRRILRKYPKKLGVNVEGNQVNRQVDMRVLLDADDLDSVVSKIIEDRLTAILYASPDEYMKHLKVILGIELDQALVDQYKEIKATRDVLIHNNGVANELYVIKAGNLKRSEADEALTVDLKYFDQSVAILKRLSAKIRQGVDKNFSEKQKAPATKT